MPETYTQPNSLRNILFSAMIILVGWNSFWLFWLGVTPGPNVSSHLTATVFRYTPRVQGAIGVTRANSGSPLPVRIENTDRFRKLRIEESLQPPPLAPEYAAVFPGDGNRALRDGIAEWALIPVDAPTGLVGMVEKQEVFLPTASGSPAVVIEMTDGLREAGFSPASLPADVVHTAAEKWVVASAMVELGADGQVQHVWLDAPSGIRVVDQAFVRALYAGEVSRGDRSVRGRVSVRIAGRSKG